MTDRPWWAPVVQWTLWFVVMSLVMGWMARSRTRAPGQSGSELRHPRSTLILGCLCTGFFVALVLISNLTGNETATWWTTAFFAILALLSCTMVLDFFTARHSLSDDSMSYQPWFGPRRQLRWSELKSVRYAPILKWFRLETESGQVARLSVMLAGLPEFAQQVLRHAPREAIADSREILESTAGGDPPSPW